ncbi:MAG: hypothetical protein HY303_20010 [Candidatus Wallbacteria bacterium]|nr:hypothetical protein [Candidatus Wallbacteria bacterium]
MTKTRSVPRSKSVLGLLEASVKLMVAAVRTCSDPALRSLSETGLPLAASVPLMAIVAFCRCVSAPKAAVTLKT